MFKNLKEKMKNKKGFTLVELIVVIVIILVLAAVMVPSLMKYVDKANQANCKADAATILSQIQADFVATQAEETGVTTVSAIGGVTIDTPLTTGSVNPANIAPDHCIYLVTTDASSTSKNYSEITGFGYNNGKFTATWSAADGWKVAKSTYTVPTP